MDAPFTMRPQLPARSMSLLAGDDTRTRRARSGVCVAGGSSLIVHQGYLVLSSLQSSIFSPQRELVALRLFSRLLFCREFLKLSTSFVSFHKHVSALAAVFFVDV